LTTRCQLPLEVNNYDQHLGLGNDNTLSFQLEVGDLSSALDVL